MSTDKSSSRRPLSRQQRRALLAGGLVLGLGTTMTLAAWSDGVFVNGSFTAGTFGIQGAVDAAGTAWQEYDSSTAPGTLTFTATPTAMSPGDSTYAPLNLRVDPAKNSYDAAITLPTAPTGPATVSTANSAFFNALTLTLYNAAPGSCTAGGTSALTPITGFNAVPLTTTKTTTMFTLPKNSTAYGVCFKITLASTAPSDVQGGTTGALTWKFNGTSV